MQQAILKILSTLILLGIIKFDILWTNVDNNFDISSCVFGKWSIKYKKPEYILVMLNNTNPKSKDNKDTYNDLI